MLRFQIGNVAFYTVGQSNGIDLVFAGEGMYPDAPLKLLAAQLAQAPGKAITPRLVLFGNVVKYNSPLLIPFVRDRYSKSL